MGTASCTLVTRNFRGSETSVHTYSRIYLWCSQYLLFHGFRTEWYVPSFPESISSFYGRSGRGFGPSGATARTHRQVEVIRSEKSPCRVLTCGDDWSQSSPSRLGTRHHQSQYLTRDLYSCICGIFMHVMQGLDAGSPWSFLWVSVNVHPGVIIRLGAIFTPVPAKLVLVGRC